MSEKPIDRSDWKRYFERTKERPPRSLLIEALPFIKNRDAALDLGSGALNDSVYLLDQGFKSVTAVDIEPVAADKAGALPQDRFQYVVSSFEAYDFPKDTFDLINAQYSLPFTEQESFDEVFHKIQASLKSEGIFTGQLFGERDEWNRKNTIMNFHTSAQIKDLFSNLRLLTLTEEEGDGVTSIGDMKYRHVFHFIAQKP